jgi:hypothetical protein
MTYDMNDMGEAAVGAFSAVLFFFAIRQGDPLTVDPIIGFVIGFAWVGLIYMANRGPKKIRKEATKHLVGNLLIVMALTFVLSVAFKMGDISMLLSFDYFGSAAWIAVWLGLPVATLFDMNNFTNVLSRYYAHKRK